ncbi:MAG: DEAD/DEAH box helicase [Naasia sp.]
MTSSPSTTTSSFAQLGVPAPLVAELTAQGIASPFPIQVDTLPDTLAGRDVLGRGRTGSGKTLAFSLPLVARLGGRLAGGARRSGRPLALVLAPTRELATQIAAVIEPLASKYSLTTTTIFGGVNQSRQVNALRAGVDIVVACPGRLEDLMKQKLISLDGIEITVIDEADHMADLGFLPSVTRILAATPQHGQRLLFSATLDNGVDKLVQRFLHDPRMHSVDEANSPVAAMTHHVFEVSGPDAKKALVQKLASGTGRRVLFLRTKHHAKKLAASLIAAGIPAVDLQGNLSQPQRDRNLAAFSDGSVRVLVATDVAARGVHVDAIELVVHVDPPTEHKAYLHRSGRTARAGSEGDVVTISLPGERKDVAALLRKASIQVQPTQVTTSSPEVLALVGEEAPYVKPVPKVEQNRAAGTSQGANAQRKRAARGGNGGGEQRRDGRPARGTDSAERGSSRGGSRRGSGRPAEDRSPERAAAPVERREQAPARTASAPAARAGSRRASSGGGAPTKLTVGSVVRSNGGGQRRGR